MRCQYGMVLCMGLALVLSGCGSSGEADKTAPQSTATNVAANKADTGKSDADPAGAVRDFLEAVRTGDDGQAAAMLTDLARTKTAEQNIEVAPRGSDTAKYEVGEVEMLADDGARVSATWTDLDHTGQSQTNRMQWMVRKQPAGWRIAGMAAEVFAGEPPLLLDFEKPEETLQKLEKLREEVRRRAESATAQARQPENASAPVQR